MKYKIKSKREVPTLTLVLWPFIWWTQELQQERRSKSLPNAKGETFDLGVATQRGHPGDHAQRTGHGHRSPSEPLWPSFRCYLHCYKIESKMCQLFKNFNTWGNRATTKMAVIYFWKQFCPLSSAPLVITIIKSSPHQHTLNWVLV